MSVIFVLVGVSEASVQCARCDSLTPVKQLECAASCYQGMDRAQWRICPDTTLSGVLLAVL